MCETYREVMFELFTGHSAETGEPLSRERIPPFDGVRGPTLAERIFGKQNIRRCMVCGTENHIDHIDCWYCVEMGPVLAEIEAADRAKIEVAEIDAASRPRVDWMRRGE